MNIKTGNTVIFFFFLQLGLDCQNKILRNQYCYETILDFNWENVITRFRTILKYREKLNNNNFTEKFYTEKLQVKDLFSWDSKYN